MVLQKLLAIMKLYLSELTQEGVCVVQVREVLLPYTSSQVAVASNKLQELFEAIPFPDKQR